MAVRIVAVLSLGVQGVHNIAGWVAQVVWGRLTLLESANAKTCGVLSDKSCRESLAALLAIGVLGSVMESSVLTSVGILHCEQELLRSSVVKAAGVLCRAGMGSHDCSYCMVGTDNPSPSL